MNRVVQPEQLDVLPASDPRARAARRDLRRINALMGTSRILAREIGRGSPLPAGSRVIDLGSGDGHGIARLTARCRWPAGVLDLVDRITGPDPEVVKALEAAGWTVRCHRRDVFEFLADPGPGRAELVVTSLFLHHFESTALERLLAGIAAVGGRVVACEPRRSRLALLAARLLGLIGCQAVTRHDAVVSVKAGFRDGELSARWPRGFGPRPREGPAGPFGHRFTAGGPPR